MPTANRCGRMEWAGPFGDVGTLIPFLVAYITLFKMDRPCRRAVRFWRRQTRVRLVPLLLATKLP
jgi:hypothetical protein